LPIFFSSCRLLKIGQGHDPEQGVKRTFPEKIENLIPGFPEAGGAAILKDDDGEIMAYGIIGRAENAYLGGDPADHDGVHPPFSQDPVEVRLEKSAETGFGDDDVAVFGFQFGDDLGSGLSTNSMRLRSGLEKKIIGHQRIVGIINRDGLLTAEPDRRLKIGNDPEAFFAYGRGPSCRIKSSSISEMINAGFMECSIMT